MRERLNVIMRARADYAYVARFLWLAICWGLAIGYLLFGLAYATRYATSSLSPAFAVMARFPGRMVGHGIVQIIVGLTLVWGVGPTAWHFHENRDWLRYRAIPLALGYAFITSAMFLCAPLVGGERNTGAIWWLIFGSLCVVLMLVRPPSRTEVLHHVEKNRAKMVNNAEDPMAVKGGGDRA